MLKKTRMQRPTESCAQNLGWEREKTRPAGWEQTKRKPVVSQADTVRRKKLKWRHALAGWKQNQ